MLSESEDWIGSAVEVLSSGGANAHAPKAIDFTPHPTKLPATSGRSRPKNRTSQAIPIRGTSRPAKAKGLSSPDTSLPATSCQSKPKGAASQAKPILPPLSPEITTIVEAHRRRWDMIRARMRLELQGQAVCRRFCDGDKKEAAKLWAKVRKDEGHELRFWIEPYLVAMQPLLAEQAAVEKRLLKEVKKLPIYEWAKSVKGFGDLSLSAVIGECAAPVCSYKSVAAVWKRMGLAVIDGERQRKVAGNKELAILHGYNAQRRSIMWNIGTCLIKANGDYKAVYDARKPIEAEKVEMPLIAHRRAQRYMEKRLLRDLYAAWRRIET